MKNDKCRKRAVVFEGDDVIAGLNFKDTDDAIVDFCEKNFRRMASVSVRDYDKVWREPRRYIRRG